MFGLASQVMSNLLAEGGRVAIEWPADSGWWDLPEVQQFERIMGSDEYTGCSWCKQTHQEALVRFVLWWTDSQSPCWISMRWFTRTWAGRRKVCVSHSRAMVSAEMVHQCSWPQLSVSTCHKEPVKHSVVERWRGTQGCKERGLRSSIKWNMGRYSGHSSSLVETPSARDRWECQDCWSLGEYNQYIAIQRTCVSGR